MQAANPIETAAPPLRRHKIAAFAPLPERAFKAGQNITDIRGETLASMQLCPPLYADIMVKALRRSAVLPAEARAQALLRAAAIFTADCLCGLSLQAYIELTARQSGLPENVVKKAADYITESLWLAAQSESLGQMQPSFLNPRGEAARRGCAQWRRKGDVLAVIAPGNSPGVHALWLQALALGYKVAVRPSAREPFTPQRLAAALVKAGLQDYIGFFPADYSGAEALLQAADCALVYGGDDAVRRYKTRANILVQGPGRSKILIGEDYPPAAALPLIFESAAGLGGMACVCASAVLAEGGAEAAAALARAFYAFAHEKFADSETRQDWALRLSEERFAWLMRQAEAASGQGRLAGEMASCKNMDGTYSAMPLIRIAESAADPIMQSELPAASVSFAPFACGRDMPFIGDSLVLTAATADEELIAALDARSEIRNLYIGAVPTVWMRPDVPHDGFLSEFLMTARGFRRL